MLRTITTYQLWGDEDERLKTEGGCHGRGVTSETEYRMSGDDEECSKESSVKWVQGTGIGHGPHNGAAPLRKPPEGRGPTDCFILSVAHYTDQLQLPNPPCLHMVPWTSA